MSPPIGFFLPAETDQHAGTMMAWPTAFSVLEEDHVYPSADLDATRKELAGIARAISEFEPLHLFVRDPAVGEFGRHKDTNLESAKALLGDAPNVTIHLTQNVHSLWARDTGPVFVRSLAGPVNIEWDVEDDAGSGFQKKNTSSSIIGLLLSFNQWGRKDRPNVDCRTAATVAEALDKSAVLAPFIAEGGGLIWDGEGTMLATESAILNPNRNPGISKTTIENHFAHCFGIQKTIWVPGKRGEDITDDHIDALARFTSPGVVVLSKKHGASHESYDSLKSVLSTATDAKGRSIETIDIPEPDPRVVLGEGYDPESGPNVAYVNFHIVNGGVVMAAFGDQEKDAEAKRIISECFKDRQVVQVPLRQLAMQGGGIHCSTQQIPL